MGLLILIPVLAVLGWLALCAVRSFMARRVGWTWWTALAACLAIGIVSGVWFGFFFEYQPFPRLRIIGCPIPVVVFALETDADGNQCWTDFVSPVPWFFAISNVFLFSFVSIYPVWLANVLWRTASQRQWGSAILGWAYLVFGVLMVANAIIAGPHAFGGGLSAVVWMAVAGLALGLCGAHVLWRNRHTARRGSQQDGPKS